MRRSIGIPRIWFLARYRQLVVATHIRSNVHNANGMNNLFQNNCLQNNQEFPHASSSIQSAQYVSFHLENTFFLSNLSI